MRNANDAISRLQIEDGALSNISQLLDRAVTLSAQSASGTFSGSRATLDNEFQSVMLEITRTATAAGLETGNTNLNARSVFVGNTQTATSVSASFISFALTTAVDATGLGISSQNLTTAANASLALTAIQASVNALGDVQGRVGAAMNRMQYAAQQAQTMYVSVTAAESRIRDADIATEAANMTKFNILTQSGLAALGQANQSSAAVLSLLR
jgi:flagellin